MSGLAVSCSAIRLVVTQSAVLSKGVINKWMRLYSMIVLHKSASQLNLNTMPELCIQDRVAAPSVPCLSLSARLPFDPPPFSSAVSSRTDLSSSPSSPAAPAHHFKAIYRDAPQLSISDAISASPKCACARRRWETCNFLPLGGHA